MRYIYLVLLMVVLVGCVEPDPMRAAIANERTIQANNSQAAQAAQIDRAQQSDTDARNAQAMLLALQSQNAIVQGQTAQAQALAQIEIARTIAEASKTDYTPLYAGMAALVVIIIAWLLIVARRPVVQSVAPRLLFQSAHAEAWLMVDGSIHLRRLSDGQARVYLPGDAMYAKLLAP
ncbi:MAG: hypothetical protein ABI557_11560 [Aureliella sp.]